MSEDLEKEIMDRKSNLLHTYKHQRGSIEIRELIQPVIVQGCFELEEHRYFHVINIGTTRFFGKTVHYKQDAFTSCRAYAMYYQLGELI